MNSENQRLDPAIRTAVYLYFAAGMAFLVGADMDSALRYQAAKTVPALFLLASFLGIFAILALANWDSYRRPISGRKWLFLCALSTLGFIELLLAPASYGGAAA